MIKRLSCVIFDLGVVLVHLHYDDALRRLESLCDPKRATNAQAVFGLLERDAIVASYERGEVPVAAVFEGLVRLTGFRGTPDQFKDIWHSIYAENAPMIRFGRELSNRYDVFIATNAGDLHVPYLFERFPSLRFFRDCAASCHLGAVKPERAFYERALAQFRVAPSACLFVDDRPENVEGAEACGIRSILYTEPEETIRVMALALAGDAGSIHRA